MFNQKDLPSVSEQPAEALSALAHTSTYLEAILCRLIEITPGGIRSVCSEEERDVLRLCAIVNRLWREELAMTSRYSSKPESVAATSKAKSLNSGQSR